MGALCLMAEETFQRLGVPLDEVYRLLHNWQRWAADAMPDLGVQPPPWAELWRPNLAWDASWGDPDAAPEQVEPEVNGADGYFIDRAVMRLCSKHLLVLKRHYINRREQNRMDLDAAARALGDIIAAYRAGAISDRRVP